MAGRTAESCGRLNGNLTKRLRIWKERVNDEEHAPLVEEIRNADAAKIKLINAAHHRVVNLHPNLSPYSANELTKYLDYMQIAMEGINGRTAHVQ